jgi:hypothetical protein
MNRIASAFLAVLAVLCLLLATEHRAYGFSGYVDPGSSLLALQCITSVVAATGFYLRRRIRSFFLAFRQKGSLATKAEPAPKVPADTL